MASVPTAPVNHVAIIDPTQFAQQQRGRTEAGEDGLDEVQADEGREEQPPGADPVGERDAEERDGAGEEADEVVGGHGENAY